MATRAQLEVYIASKITDELNRQNTAEVVRLVLNYLALQVFNLDEDELNISQIRQLTETLAGKADLINGKVKPEQLPELTTFWGAMAKAANDSQTIEQAISAAVASLVDSSPAALDTLKELATALGNDPNFATTIATELGNKISSTEKGQANGVATLNAEGKVPASQLPGQSQAPAGVKWLQYPSIRVEGTTVFMGVGKVEWNGIVVDYPATEFTANVAALGMQRTDTVYANPSATNIGTYGYIVGDEGLTGADKGVPAGTMPAGNTYWQGESGGTGDTGAGGGGVISVAFTTALKFDKSYFSRLNITSATHFTKAAGSHTNIPGTTYEIEVRQGATVKPTFSADFIPRWDEYKTAVNEYNRIWCKYRSDGKIVYELQYI